MVQLVWFQPEFALANHYFLELLPTGQLASWIVLGGLPSYESKLGSTSSTTHSDTSMVKALLMPQYVH